MKKLDVRTITFMAMGVALNIVGAFIASTFKLPIYMDSIGTIFVAIMLNSKYAIISGICGSIVSGITFDVYSFYFAPVQISTGYIAGLMYKRGFLNGYKKIIGVFAFAFPTAVISALISVYVFGGITSAGSTYIVRLLASIGVPLFLSAFVIQVVTEYIDKFIATVFVEVIKKSVDRTKYN